MSFAPPPEENLNSGDNISRETHEIRLHFSLVEIFEKSFPFRVRKVTFSNDQSKKRPVLETREEENKKREID